MIVHGLQTIIGKSCSFLLDFQNWKHKSRPRHRQGNCHKSAVEC